MTKDPFHIDDNHLTPEWQAIARGLVTSLRGSGGLVYRYLFLDGSGLASLGHDGTIGQHWTTDASDLSFDALHVPAEADKSWLLYEVSGRINSATDVDLKATIEQRAAIPWEQEVVVNADADLVVEAVHLVDETTRRRLRKVRQDLTGCSLRASREKTQPRP